MEPEATPPPASPTSPPTVTTVTAEMATGQPDLVDLNRVETELAGVEHALARLEAGTYGTCEVCGAALDDARLEASPTCRRCPTHS